MHSESINIVTTTVSICFTPCHHKYKQLPQRQNQKFTGIALPTAEKEEKQAFAAVLQKIWYV